MSVIPFFLAKSSMDDFCFHIMVFALAAVGVCWLISLCFSVLNLNTSVFLR